MFWNISYITWGWGEICFGFLVNCSWGVQTWTQLRKDITYGGHQGSLHQIPRHQSFGTGSVHHRGETSTRTMDNQ